MMDYRKLAFGALAMAVVAGSAFVCAAEKHEKVTHEGLVVSITSEKLVMSDRDGKNEHTHTLTDKTKVTWDGKHCKATDLKAGAKIRVTTHGDDKVAASRIEGIDKHTAFASHDHEGMVVSVKGNKLDMTDDDGKHEHTHALADDAKVTCDGKVCQAADLKKGMRIRVTTEKKAPHSATHVEALDKNADFAAL